jgi:hypothetical protein
MISVGAVINSNLCPAPERPQPWRVKPAPGKMLALRVLSGKKEFIVTRNDIAGFVH